MHDALDIYIKLVIAILSFIAPLMVYLLSISNDGIADIREKMIRYKEGLDRLIGGPKSPAHSDEDLLIEVYQHKKQVLQRRINLLNPKRQIYRIFLPLAGSIFAVAVEKLCKQFFGNYCWLTWGLIALSLVSFGYAVYVLKQVAWEVIETKQMLAEKGGPQTAQATQPIINPSPSGQNPSGPIPSPADPTPDLPMPGS